ncbi:hypothetical protein Syn6312_1697 [Synechococcus sp. PCC 6312]|nr:hypothetical protein Syn6312_1697 [Synechococcus sp. PCC 6312]
MELTLSEFAAWSQQLTPSQLQVLIAIQLLKSSSAEEISKTIQTSERNVKRIIKELKILNLIQVNRETLIEAVPTIHTKSDPELPVLSLNYQFCHFRKQKIQKSNLMNRRKFKTKTSPKTLEALQCKRLKQIYQNLTKKI